MTRLFVLVVLSFFGGWLIKYFDERMTLRDWFASIIFDPVMVVVLSLISLLLLYMAYGLLRLVFAGV
jgi:hypothetical protein